MGGWHCRHRGQRVQRPQSQRALDASEKLLRVQWAWSSERGSGERSGCLRGLCNVAALGGAEVRRRTGLYKAGGLGLFLRVKWAARESARQRGDLVSRDHSNCSPGKRVFVGLLGHHTEHHRWVADTETCAVTVLEATRLRSGCWQVWFLPRPLSLARRGPSSPCVLAGSLSCACWCIPGVSRCAQVSSLGKDTSQAGSGHTLMASL